MRILMFLHSFGPGGVERVGLRLAGAWTERGQDVRVLIGRNEGPDRSLAPSNITYDFAPPHPLARPFETLWMVRQLVAAVRRHRPDVLFCAGNTYTIVAAIARLLLRSECPPIVCKLSNSLDRHDLPAVFRLAYRLWLKQHRHFIDRFVGLSEPMRTEIEQILELSSERVHIIPNPVLSRSDVHELSRARTRGAGEGRRFIAIGRLTRQKNYRLLLRAFAQIADSDDRLLILGDGPERRRLVKLAAKLGIEERVHLPGHDPRVAPLLKSADVFVTSSNYEGLPGAVVEALAAGLPIVATRSSACLSHLLRQGELGELVDIRDVEGLAHGLRHAGTRTLPQSAGVSSVVAAYTIERSADLYLQVLADAAAARAPMSGWTAAQPLAKAA